MGTSISNSVLAFLRYICPRLSASVTNCSGLDFFLNLQADPAAPVRRFAAYFLQHLLLFKPGPCISAESTIQEHEISPRFPATLYIIFRKLRPSLSLRCSIAITSLLGDSDNLATTLQSNCHTVVHFGKWTMWQVLPIMPCVAKYVAIPKAT